MLLTAIRKAVHRIDAFMAEPPVDETALIRKLRARIADLRGALVDVGREATIDRAHLVAADAIRHDDENNLR